MAQKKLGFEGVSGITMVPRAFALSEIFRKNPTLTDAIALIQGDGAECKIGKGFASFQFFGLSGCAGAQEQAKASYLASAINAARPTQLFEQIASVRGAAVSVDIHLLRRMREMLSAQYILNDVDMHQSGIGHTLQALQALELLIEERHSRAAPVQEGMSETSRARKVSDVAHY